MLSSLQITRKLINVSTLLVEDTSLWPLSYTALFKQFLKRLHLSVILFVVFLLVLI